MSEIINGVGRVGIRNYVPSNSNAFPTSNLFAYSFRKVVPTATLSFRVRRSSDNAEQNIGFVGNDLDTTSLLSFVGAGNGFVVKMYNQVSSTSTAGNDLVQTYASAQFQIVVSGVVNTLNGKPSCTTGNGKYMLTTTLFNPSVINGTSIFSVTKPIGQIGGGYSVDWIYSIGNGSLGTDRFLDHHIGGASGNPTTYNQSVQSDLSNISTPYTSGTKFQSHLIKSGSNKYYQNNVLVGSNTTALVTPGSGHRLVINNISWSFGTTSFANQYFSEILVYNSDETSNLETIHNNISSYYTPAYTARTTAFAAATGITDATILNALNTFDTGLISNGLDTKMKALYPFVGGTANTHKFNFMDARDSDAAFRLQFNGGMIHSSNGVLFGGVNGWADTYIQSSSVLSLNSTHASIYSRTNNSTTCFDIDSVISQTLTIATNFGGGTTYYKVNQNSYSTVLDSDSLGMRLISRVSSSIAKLYKNQNLISSSSITSQSLSTGNINIGRFYNGGYYSNRQYAFMTVGDGLTDTEASTFYSLVQAMQTSLSRQV